MMILLIILLIINLLIINLSWFDALLMILLGLFY